MSVIKNDSGNFIATPCLDITADVSSVDALTCIGQVRLVGRDTSIGSMSARYSKLMKLLLC